MTAAVAPRGIAAPGRRAFQAGVRAGTGHGPAPACDQRYRAATEGRRPGRRRRYRASVRARGFTLIELVLAVTTLAVGVLAVAATALPVTRLIRRGDAQAAAAAAAAGRIETLRAQGCGAAGSGEVVVAGRYHLRWTVASSGPLRAVRVVATYPWAGGGTRSDSYETALACP